MGKVHNFADQEKFRDEDRDEIELPISDSKLLHYNTSIVNYLRSRQSNVQHEVRILNYEIAQLELKLKLLVTEQNAITSVLLNYEEL